MYSGQVLGCYSFASLFCIVAPGKRYMRAKRMRTKVSHKNSDKLDKSYGKGSVLGATKVGGTNQETGGPRYVVISFSQRFGRALNTKMQKATGDGPPGGQ